MSTLSLISWFSLALALLSAIIIAADELRHPQKMWIMNIVWPVTALYFSVVAVWAYFTIGRGAAKNDMQGMSGGHMKAHANNHEEQARSDPTWQQTSVAVSHCGAGCTIGDIIAEFTIFGLGLSLFPCLGVFCCRIETGRIWIGKAANSTGAAMVSCLLSPCFATRSLRRAGSRPVLRKSYLERSGPRSPSHRGQAYLSTEHWRPAPERRSPHWPARC